MARAKQQQRRQQHPAKKSGEATATGRPPKRPPTGYNLFYHEFRKTCTGPIGGLNALTTAVVKAWQVCSRKVYSLCGGAAMVRSTLMRPFS
jgi:hypothetical protein